MEKQKQNEVQKAPENNKETQLQSLQNIAKLFQGGRVSPEQKQSGIDYLIKLAQVESKYENQKDNIKNDVKYFLEASMQNRLYKHLGEYNINTFDADKNGQIDQKEEQDYGNALSEAITQIVILGGINNFSQVHYDSDSKDGFSNGDKWLATKVDISKYIMGEKGKKGFAEELIQKAGDISEEELHKMQETKFSPTSSESWKHLGILLAKEFGNGVEDVLRFLTNIPGGIILIPRYLSFRAMTGDDNLDPKSKTEYEIKRKELVEQNPSLGLLELLGEKGVEMIKKLGEMLSSGKQGDIAMMMVTIAGLIAGGAGAAKLGLTLARKSAVKGARLAGRESRIAGETTANSTRNNLKDAGKKVGKVAHVAGRIDDIVGGAGIGHLTGQFSVKDNIAKSKSAREQSHFEELVGKEKVLENISYKSKKINEYYLVQNKIEELCNQYEIRMNIEADGNITFEKGFHEKVPQELYGNYQDILDLVAHQKMALNEINALLGLDLAYGKYVNFEHHLMQKGEIEVLEKLGFFTKRNAMFLLYNNNYEFVSAYAQKFGIVFDKELLFRLSEISIGGVIKNKTYFGDIFNMQDILEYLKKQGKLDSIVGNLSELNELGLILDKKLFLDLLETQNSFYSLSREINKFSGVDKDVLQKIYEKGFLESYIKSDFVISGTYISKDIFSSFTQTIEVGFLGEKDFSFILKNSKKFSPEVFDRTFLLQVISEGNLWELFTYIELFTKNGIKLDGEMAKMMFEKDRNTFLKNIDRFELSGEEKMMYQLGWSDLTYLQEFKKQLSEKPNGIFILENFSKLDYFNHISRFQNFLNSLSPELGKNFLDTLVFLNDQGIQFDLKIGLYGHFSDQISLGRLDESMFNKDMLLSFIKYGDKAEIFDELGYWRFFSLITKGDITIDDFLKKVSSLQESGINIRYVSDINLEAFDNIVSIILKYKSLGFDFTSNTSEIIAKTLQYAKTDTQKLDEILQKLFLYNKKYSNISSKSSGSMPSWLNGNEDNLSSQKVEIFSSLSHKEKEALSNLIKKTGGEDIDKFFAIIERVHFSKSDMLKNLFEYKSTNFDLKTLYQGDIFSYIISLSNPLKELDILEDFIIKNGNYFYQRFEELSSKYSNQTIFKILTASKGSVENFEKVIVLYEKIQTSKSTEVVKLTDNIFDNILDHPYPEKALEAIEKVFIRNGIPMVGKLYRVFEQLYSDAKMDQLIAQNLSPVLVTKTSNNVRRFTMYRDLLKAHLLSGEATLRNYLETLSSGGELIKKYEKGEKLTQSEKTELLYVLHKMNALGENKNIKLSSLENYAELSQDIENVLSQIKTSFGVKENESLLARVNEMFLKPIGIQSIDEALQIMNTTKKQADSRGRQYFETASSKEDGLYITLPESGDLAKGFESQYIGNIQNDGFVARDFLGTEGVNDRTPFDIDLIKLGENNSLNWLVNNSEASKYGDVIAIIKNKGDIIETTLETVGSYDKTKFELFKTGVLGEDHYGIRTALPSTQIDYLIYKGTPENVESVFFQIAKSGVYTPVVDVNGKIIFTPEMFDFMKQSIFGGINEWGHEKIDLTPLSRDSKMYDSMISQLPKAQKFQEVASVKSKIMGMLGQALESSGMQLKTTKTDSIHFVEINDTGSTARYTNLDGGYDFDLDLRLNEADYKNVPQIIENIKTLFSPDLVEQTVTKDNLVQYVIKGALVNGEKMDIDLLFTKYRTGNIIDANQVLKLKLDAIKKQYGEQRYNEVLAQIRLAKTIMKESEVYKKGNIVGGQGGLGGIGIEAWILNNGGNIQNAFSSFYASAVQNGEIKLFADFKKDYHIYSAGENLRNSQIEDFINNMDENGYKKMVEIVKKYLNN